MKLATYIEAERGKPITKTANEFIFQEFTVNKEPVGQIELYYFDDQEWLLKYRQDDDSDWNIIAQGNL